MNVYEIRKKAAAKGHHVFPPGVLLRLSSSWGRDIFSRIWPEEEDGEEEMVAGRVKLEQFYSILLCLGEEKK